jgi:hypothetical protein
LNKIYEEFIFKRIAFDRVDRGLFPGWEKTEVEKSGNPVFEGWYADPEGIIYDDTYWIYPTWSDLFEKQVFSIVFPRKT